MRKNIRSVRNKGKKAAAVGLAACLLLGLLLVWSGISGTNQSVQPTGPVLTLEGEYRIGDGPWQPIEEGKHIPFSKGDVALRGTVCMNAPDTGERIGPVPQGTVIALYLNHAKLQVQEVGCPVMDYMPEDPRAGADLCGESWIGHRLQGAGDEPITLLLHNPHRFGNETAVDELLSGLAVYNGADFEKEQLQAGSGQRNVGFFFVAAALVLLGTALVSSLLHIKGSDSMWLVGLAVVLAGGCFIYDAPGVPFWSRTVITNTTVLMLCRMLYMLAVSVFAAGLAQGKCRKAAVAAAAAVGAVCIALTLIALVTAIPYYDMLPVWVAVQGLACAVLLCCLLPGVRKKSGVQRWLTVGTLLPLAAFFADGAAAAFGLWRGAAASKVVFAVLFAAALVTAWRLLPKSIHAAVKAKELETEQRILRAQLQESRVAIMISQIQPHFIYNTLGTVEQLCLEQPKKAAALVRDFSLYLRGNFSELDRTTPIRFTQEMEHVKHYTDIEQVRFPDMTVRYDLRSVDFLLPALTVQPLVENAIKHGLMGLEQGGTVTVRAYETETHYCVCVSDNGVGFDPAAPVEERCVGLKNIRGRLEAMLGGTLEVKSAPGQGTEALIMIPKE